MKSIRVEFGNKFHAGCAEFHDERSERNSSEQVKFIPEFHENGFDSMIIEWIFGYLLQQSIWYAQTSDKAWTSGIKSTAVLKSNWLTSNNHSIINEI